MGPSSGMVVHRFESCAGTQASVVLARVNQLFLWQKMLLNSRNMFPIS